MLNFVPTAPTRGINLLDVTFSSEDNVIINSEVTITPNLSDHNYVEYELRLKNLMNNKSDEEIDLENHDFKHPKTLNLKHDNSQIWSRVNNYLNKTDWGEYLSREDTD